MTDEVEEIDPARLLPNGDGEMSEEDQLKDIIHRQEIAITVLRERVGELEMELINTRCMMYDHQH